VSAVTIHPSKETLDQANVLARAHDTTVEELLTHFIDKLFRGEPIDLVSGMFFDEPELIDELLEGIMKERELRNGGTQREPE
jgi:hypothetical protein